MFSPQWKTKAALGMLVLSVLGAAGCSSDSQESKAPEIPAGIIRHDTPVAAEVEGEKIKQKQALGAGLYESPKQMYQTTCAQCHDTGVGPVLFGRSLDANYIAFTVRHGRNGMPAFMPSDYSDSDVQQLATWIGKQPKPAQAEGGAQ
jgi:mono/diheme cytochrome c family protein